MKLDIKFGPRTCVLRASPTNLQRLLELAARGAKAAGYDFPNGEPERGRYMEIESLCRDAADLIEHEELEYIRARGEK